MPPPFLRYLLSKELQGKELTDEKIRDFKHIILTQALMIFTLFLLEVVEAYPFPYDIEIAETLFFATLGVYAFQLWDALRNYTTNRRVIRMNLVFIIGVFLFGFICVNPFFPMEPTLPYRITLLGIFGSLLVVEFSVIYFTILEFFKKDLGLEIRLWGAAALYLMIGLCFGSVYEILCIIQPDCLGVDLPLRALAYMNRLDFSLMILGGMEIPFEPSGILYSVGMIEALWGQIFIVLIVGRLLVK
jgi:hypothetical protein